MNFSGAADPEPAPATGALRLVIAGHVQAVGFRPFVYRLAIDLGLSGWIRNRTGSVEILIAGSDEALACFEHDVVHASPPLADPLIETRAPADHGEIPDAGSEFEILESESGDEPLIFVPPDYFMCPDCNSELMSPDDRRFRYPFINCTQCGPRYTLIRGMPYDRALTTMAAFELCDACEREYTNPLDRRFHAEPLACPACGPQLEYLTQDAAERVAGDPLDAAVQALRAGQIVAVKGIGGYHLMCDARNDAAVTELRRRKARPDKPLAVMFPAAGEDGLDRVRLCADVSDDAATLISGPGRPIVLVPLLGEHPLATGIAPGLGEVGVFLPYSPLHHLLLDDYDGPLVATSGNRSGEPVLTDNDEAGTRLAGIAHAFLHHNRPIERPADDPVFRKVAGRFRPIRLGRGAAPLELALHKSMPEPVLAVGGHLKNTVALAWDDRVVVSPHIGEMSAPRSVHILEQIAADLQRLYGVTARALISDAHPGYATSHWARQQGLPAYKVLHHHAHAAALAGEYPEVDNWLVFTWDGVGMGEDGSLWGGEAFYGGPGTWRRVASLKSFHLPGGDLAGRQPWRSAAAICWESGNDWPEQDAIDATALVRQAWQRGLNCHATSAAGRLFDAAASLVLGAHETSFEGQGPMQLEAAAGDTGPVIELPLCQDDSGVPRLDWRPLLPMLCDTTIPVATRAAGFHLSLAKAIANTAAAVSEYVRFDRIGLTGGVFQNARLAAATVAALAARGYDAVLPTTIPCNDGGLSYGQIIEHLARARDDV